MIKNYKYLDNINFPSDLRKISENDKTRVERKMEDFEKLWNNKTKYVDVWDFMYAEENNLLKYSSKWVTHV